MHDLITHYLASQPVFSPKGLTRLVLNDTPLGWLGEHELALVRTVPGLHIGDTARWQGSWDEAATVWQRWGETERDAGRIHGWRNERYCAFAPDRNGMPDLTRPLFAIERALFRTLGLTSRAVHVNGHTPDHLWVATRAPSKAVDPGKRDNLAAGGIAAHENAGHCVIRELAEEAGVPSGLAQQAQHVETLRSTRCVADGVHDEILYVYDLALPADFSPVNQDGEVAAFERIPFANAAALLPAMTLDAGLVTARFLLRHG